MPGDIVEKGNTASASDSRIKFDVESLRVGSASSIGSESRSTAFLSEEDDEFPTDEEGYVILIAEWVKSVPSEMHFYY